MYRFSPSQRQFYVEGIHDRVPADAFDVTLELHAEFVAAQARGQFKTIRAGRLVPIAPPMVEGVDYAALARLRRDALIAASDWTLLQDAPFTNEQRSVWVAYRQALRDVPQQEGFPSNIEWPEKPQ